MTRLSVIIPALDAEATVALAIAALDDGGGPDEVIVVDGGSRDATVSVAEAAGARVIRTERGRGAQLAAGTRDAAGAWLLFLHADTRLAEGWRAAVDRHLERPEAEGLAAVFRFALDDDAPAARRLEAMVAWRTRVLGLPFGDQGLLISRALYDAVGGFRPMVLMEDVDIVRRIGRRRFRQLPVRAVTSAARYRRDGYLARSARNLACLFLYLLGVPPERIAGLYR